MEEIFRALSSEIRLKILQVLSEGARTVSELVDRFSVTQPTISHHLKVLKEVGLVVEKRYKKWVYYSLNTEFIEKIRVFFDGLFKKRR